MNNYETIKKANKELIEYRNKLIHYNENINTNKVIIKLNELISILEV
ncbi:unnamed protein product [marine sediment metagenome]|uniref:Uncharacterized protein n=1 Tax=marine sediment metagenome TaxID=412755 RepID=X0VXV0_9ZZZZ